VNRICLEALDAQGDEAVGTRAVKGAIAVSAPSACGRTLWFPRLEDRDQTTLDSLRDELRQLLIGLVPLPDGFDGKANLYSELGMSSLKAIELLMTQEERHGARFRIKSS
jgi:hypothetical protein